MIIGLLPSNSTFGPFQGNDYHYKQILQDNNKEQFIVITTPSTFNKGGKLYLRPLETANDRNTSFEVKDAKLYKPLDITDIKITSEMDNVLKLRQSEPIKLYAKRHPGESSFDAEVRLSDRLRDIKDLSSFTFKISQNTESWDLYQSEDPSTREQLGVEGFTNPRLRVGAEEITVEVMNGNESIGFLQGPTGAILLDEYNNVINPLSLTEDQVDEYFQIYATKSSLRTKAEQLQIIKNNYASSILLNEKLKQLLGGDVEAIININSIKGLELRVSEGKMMFAQKDKGATFSELYSNTVDGTNIWVVDNRSDGKGGVITNITEDEVYERTEAIVDAASNQSGYNPLQTKRRYVAATRLPNGTFTFVELKASELSATESNQMVVDILNTQDKTLAENIDEKNDEVKEESANFAFNEKLKDDFYIFGKSGEFIDIELTARGDVQVIYRNTRKEGIDGKALRITYTINENELKSVKESKNNFTDFLTVLNNKIKFKDSGLEVKSGLVLKADNFRKSIPKEATVKDLASVITNFEKGLRKNIRVEAVITDSAQINNVINNAELPTYVKNNVEKQIKDTDKVIMETEIESPELTPEYMISLHKGGFTNVENSTLKLIARKLATDQELSNAERTIYTNTKNTNIRDSINLLKLTYKSGVIEEGAITDVDISTVITEKSPTRKTADKIKELQDKYDDLENKIWDDTFNEINEGNPEKTAGDAQITIKANEAANDAIENSEELKALDAEIEALKKKLAPKVINSKLGDAHIEQIDTFITWAKENLPDFIQVQDIQDLSARLKENGKTAGMFVLEVQEMYFDYLGGNRWKKWTGDIYVGAHTPFKYHEAFHSVFRMLLSEEEIKKYLALAKKEKLAELRSEGKTLGEAIHELRSSHSIYNKLSYKELTERLYEEYLADKFNDFKRNPKGTKTDSFIKSLFTKLIEWVKAVIKRFSKNELTTLFENIDTGKYARSTVQENRFTNQGVGYGVEGITSVAPKVIPVDTIEHSYPDPFTGQEIVSLSNVYMSANDQRKMIATIAALYRSYVERGDLLIMSKKAVLDTAISDYTKLLNPKREYYKSEVSGISFRSIRKKLKTYYRALKTNSDIIAENVSNYLNIFESKFQIEQDAFEEYQHDENTNVRKIDEYGKSANQIGGAMSLSTELRTFIATTVLEEQDLFGNKETLEGVPIVTTVDFNFGYNGLVKALANKTTDLQLLQALALFSSTNKNTAAVANNIFKEIGITDPISLLDAQQLPKISNPEFLQKVIKGFNMMTVDYMLAHKDEDSKIVFIYAANKKDDGNTQIDQWSQHFDQVYPTLQSKEGKKKAVSFLNLLNSKILNPKERSRNDLDILAKAESKKIYDQIGIQLNPATIKYSILSNKVNRKNWEEAFVSLGLAAGVDPITAEDITELRLSIGRGENIFLDNQTNIPENEADEQNTPEEIDSSTGISSRLKKMAKTNAHFDETIGSTVFRDTKGNLIYGAQMPTFHLVKVAEMSEKNWAETKIKENAFFNRNYLLNNAKFKAHAASGKLKVSRFIGSKEGRLTENEFGSIVENRGLHINQQEGVSFGESSGAEFIADVINAYVYKYNRNSQSVPLNPYVNDNGKDLFYITSPVDTKVLSDASSSDFMSLPIEKMVEQDENGDIKLTEHTTDALINNILQAEYERVARELDPNTADTDIIEGFNTDDIRKGVQLGQRGKRFVRSRGFITSRKSKIKVIGGIKTPLMSRQTKDDIISKDQRIILRGGKAFAAIGLNSGQESPVIMDFKVDDQLKSESFVLKNKGLISVNNINIDQYIKDLGNAVSKKPIAGKKKQNTAKIGEVTFYFQRGDDAKFFSGNIEQYVYEFVPLDEAGIEIGVEEVETTEGTEQEVAYFESDTFVEETLIGAAKEGLSFDDAVKRIGEEKLKEIIEKRIFTDFFDFRRLLNNIKATDKISVEISEGLGMIVRPEKGKRGKAYHQVTTKGREAMKLYNLKENDLDFNLAQIYMNQYINARSFNDLLLGDHSYLFENFTAETKRAKMQNAAGPSAASALIAPKFGINHTFMSDNSISLITYHDPKVAKRFGNGTIDPTDAQMVGTIKAFRYFWFGIGQLSTEQADLLDRIERGDIITSDEMWGNVALGTEGYIKLNAIINSKKFVYGDGRVNLKMSFFVLTPQLTSYKDKFGQWKALPQMEELHNLRVKLEELELGKETVGIAIPTSGSKMMKKNVITAKDMYGPQSIAEIQENNKDRNGGDRNVIQGLNPKWMRLQVVNPSNKVWGIDPRQMKQLITTEQTDKTIVVIDGKEFPIKKIKEAYHNSISNQVTLRYRNKRNLIFNMDTALDEIGNSIDTGKVTVNLRSFLRYAMAGLEASQAKTQMLEFFSFDEIGNPKFDLNNPITVDKFQELFLSYFSKGVLAGNQASISAALVSSYGVKPMRIVKALDENGQPIETEIIRMEAWKAMKYKPEIADKFIEGEEGESGKWVDLKVNDVILQKLQHNVYDPESKTYYSEFMIAPHHRDILKFIKPGDIIPDVIAKAFGIRIPSQDKHSSISLKLVDFLPEFYGSSAMFADELIEISGADFDIDKLYMHIKEWFYSKGKFNEYGKATTEKGKYAQYIRYVISQVNKKGSAVNEAVINWSTNDSAFLDEEGVEDLQNELARQTASELVVDASLFKKAHTAKIMAYILEINDNITDEQVIKLYNKNEDLYGALQSLSLPVTFTEYKAYVKKHKVEPYEAAINNDILDQRIALVANEDIVKPKNGRLIGIGNEPADLEPLYEIRDYLKKEFPELADFANPEDIDPDNMLGLLETWNSIKTGEGGIGAAVRPNVVLNMLGENGIKVLSKLVNGREIYPQIRFNKTTFNTFATPYSKDGKSKDKATRTQYLVSALITMMTDNAKERLADLLSINKNSLAVVSTLSSLGVPIKTSMLLLKNPVIKLGYDLAINKPTPMSPGINTILKKRIKFLNENFKISTEPVTDEMLINAVNNDWIDTTLPLTSGFGKEMTGQTPKGYTDEQASAEYAILKQFVNARRLTDYTGKLGSLVDLLAGFGRSSEDIERKIDDFNELGIGLDNEEFSKLKDYDDVLIPIDVRPIFKGNDFRATYYKIFKEFVDDLLPAVFITRTSDFVKIKNVTLKNMIRNKMLVDPKRKAVIEKDILSYLTALSYKQFLLNSPNGIERLGSLQNGLIYDDIGGKDVLTIEHVVKSIRNYFTSQGKENYFIEKFVNLNLATSETSKAGINRLEANNWTKMSEAKVIDLQASFAEIYSEPALRDYAYDLVHYLLVKDGMQFKSNTFLNVVPAFMFDQVLRSISAGHTLFKSSTKTDGSYDLVFGKTPTELANDFTEGYLKSQQNNWLLPIVQRITKDETKAAHIDKDGNLRLKMFNGVPSYINKRGEKVIKGRKLKIQKEGKKYFIDTKTKAYKQISQNISDLSDHGITFNPIVVNGETIYEMNLPLYLRNVYRDNFGSVHVKTFELNQTYREKRFSKSGDIMNMLDGEDLIAKGWEAVYTPVETTGSNQSTAIAFALGEVPEYQALRAKYQTDPIDALIKGLGVEGLSEELSKLDLSGDALQGIYNQAVAAGAAVKTTDKGVTINGKSITSDTEVKDPTEDFDYNIEDLSPDVLKDQIKGTQLLLDLYAKKNEESPKSDVEIKVIRDWWNNPNTNKFAAQKETKRSGIDGILKEFNTFDGTAERFIELIENCK